MSSVLKGFNASIICYGQANTHTILGGPAAADRGLLPRCVAHCIDVIKESPDVVEASITLSCCEVAKE